MLSNNALPAEEMVLQAWLVCAREQADRLDPLTENPPSILDEKEEDVRRAGKMPDESPVFGNIDGDWPVPFSISDRWRDAVKSRGIPKVTFHALRHSHASALIAAGLDIVSISSRLGHASPALTLSVYSHLFNNDDANAADAMDKALGCQSGANSAGPKG